MAKSPANTIANFLATNSFGSLTSSVSAWRITVGRQMDKPDSQITVYDTGGTAANPAYRINYPALQIRVRGDVDNYAAAWSKLNDIREFLVGMDPVVLEGDNWDGIIAQNEIVSLGSDLKSRPELVLSLNCFVEPAAGSSAFMHRNSL
jgi:hypothetical protein